MPEPMSLALLIFLSAAAMAPLQLRPMAIRRGDRGLPWIPTILAILLLVLLAVMVVAAVIVG